MNNYKIINNQKKGFLKISVRGIITLLAISVSLFFVSCKKEIKAGDPIALTYDQVYMVGNATSIGWSIGDAMQVMRVG